MSLMRNDRGKAKAKVTRSENMRRIKGKNTSPELAVRRMIFRLGYRYRIHRGDLPGKPDIVFGKLRKVIFVNGCFWHSHCCQKAHHPKTNEAYWSPKLKRNKARDARHLEELRIAGWEVLTIWECQLNNMDSTEQRVIRFLKE